MIAITHDTLLLVYQEGEMYRLSSGCQARATYDHAGVRLIAGSMNAYCLPLELSKHLA